MALSLVTAATVDPVSPDDVVQHCRINVNDPAQLQRLIKTATLHVENFLERKLLNQTWDDKRAGFPRSVLTLPFPPVSSVTSITYIDTAGATQTWASNQYQTDLPAGPWAAPARIAPIAGVSYPQTSPFVFNAMTVRFVCGYGSNPINVPAPIRTSLLMLIAHWFEHPEQVNVGNIVTEMPQGIDQMLWPFKAFTECAP